MMPVSDPRDRFFYPHHTPMKDTYFTSQHVYVQTSQLWLIYTCIYIEDGSNCTGVYIDVSFLLVHFLRFFFLMAWAS